MKIEKDQLDFNFSRGFDFQKNIEKLTDDELNFLGEFNNSLLRKHLKFLITELYSLWREAPSQFLSVSMSKRGYKARSRYNPNCISSATIEAIKFLKSQSLIEFHPGFFDIKRKISRQSRIKASNSLVEIFKKYSITANDIMFPKDREFIILLDKKKKLTEYTDNFDTHEIREIVMNYNNIISKTFFDIPNLEENFIRRVDGAKIAISDYCKCQNLVYETKILGRKKFFGSWWHKLDYVTLEKISSHMLINDSDTSYLNLSSLFPFFLKQKTGVFLNNHDLELIKRKNIFINTDASLFIIISKLINSNNFSGFFRSLSNDRKKVGINMSVSKKSVEDLLIFFEKKFFRLYRLFFSKVFDWDDELAGILSNLLKNFGSANVNIPIIMIKDYFFYPSKVEKNVLNYFGMLLERKLKNQKFRLFTRKCYSYKQSSNRSIFKTLISNNLVYSKRYCNNRKKFEISMKKNRSWNNHPMSN